MIYNTIEDQKLTHANQLTIYAWNRIINILKTQANNNSQELERLINWFGFRNVRDFEEFLSGQLNGLSASLAGKMDERTILEHVLSDSDALVTSKGIYNAIPRISFDKREGYLSNINHNDTDYPLPISTFTITTKDGFMSEYKIGNDDPYKVFTPDDIPKTDTVANDDALITSKGVRNEFNKYKQITEYTTDNGNLKSIDFNGDPVSIPSTPFTVFLSIPDTDRIIYGFKIENDTYKFASGSNITVDPNVTEDSPNPVESRGIYRALADKVNAVPGKVLSENDFTDAYKTKLDTIDSTITNVQTTASNAQTIASNAQTTANEAKRIAEGRAKTHVFETRAEMYTELDKNTTYEVGDNLFIKELNVPDYWIYDVHSSIDEDPEKGRHGYYTIAQLETQKVPLTDYPTTKQMNDAIYDAIGYVLTHNVED